MTKKKVMTIEEYCNKNNKQTLLQNFMLDINPDPSKNMCCADSAICSRYSDTTFLFNFKCHICNTEWEGSGYSYIVKELTCPTCNKDSTHQKIKYASVKKGSLTLLDWCNDHEDDGQRIIDEYDDENNELTREEVFRMSYSSHISINWKCREHGHKWSATVKTRTNGHGCIECAKKNRSINVQKAKTNSENSLSTWCSNNTLQGKAITSQWTGISESGKHYTMEEISYGSIIKMLWRDEFEHGWYAAVRDRTSGRGCPYCSGRKVSDLNSLSTWCFNNKEQGQIIKSEWTGISEDGKQCTMDEVSYGSNIKMLWRCADGHEWYATISHRTAKNFERNCPYCAGQRVSDLNSLSTWCLNNPVQGQIIKNDWTGICKDDNRYKIDEVSYCSNKKMLWRDEYGHEWYTTVAARTSGNGCPECAKKMMSIKIREAKTNSENSLSTWCLNNKEQGQIITNQWTGICEDGKHYTMDEVSYASHLKMLWRDEYNHEWYATIANRTNHNTGCPECAKKIRPISIQKAMFNIENSLSTWCSCNPETGNILTSQWTGISESGKYYTMDEVTYGSSLKMLWHDEFNNEWYATIYSRTIRKGNYYTSQKVSDLNSLSTWCVDNKEQGQIIKNDWTGIGIDGKHYTMDEVSYGSGLKVLWCDEFNHEWYAAIYSRTNGSGCPYCNNQTSYAEQYIYWSLKQLYPETQNRYKAFKDIEKNGIELDVYIEELNLAIEYSPTYWHKGKEKRDNLKKKLCEQYNISLIQIIEDSFDEYEETFTENYICVPTLAPSNRDEYLQKIVSYILNSIGHSIEEINIELVKKNALEYSKKKIEYEKSVAFLYPELAKEMDNGMNNIKSDEITPGSSLRIKFLCPNCDYGEQGEWETTIHNRIYFKSGCPSCGFNWSTYESLDDLSKTLTESINNYSDEMQSWDF